jgi:hypothetical protein
MTLIPPFQSPRKYSRQQKYPAAKLPQAMTDLLPFSRCPDFFKKINLFDRNHPRMIHTKNSISKCVPLSSFIMNNLSSRKLFHTCSYSADKFGVIADDFSSDTPSRSRKLSLLDYTPKELEALVEGPVRVQQVWNLIR